MDEPSAILDDGEIETMFGVIRRLIAEGVGVIYISHRLDEIRRLGDRVTVLTDGQTVASGLPASTPVDELVELMVGRKVDQLYPDRVQGSGKVLLEARGLSRLPDVRDVSFDVYAGEVLGIGGLVGAGRSELLRAVYGVDGRDAGEVRVAGQLLQAGRPDKAIAAGLGLAPEDRKSQGLLMEWSLAKNVSLASLGKFLRRRLLSLSAEREATHRQLEALNTVPADIERVVAELSGGNQQKVVLAALASSRMPGPSAGRTHAGSGRGDESRALPGDCRPRRRGIGVVVVSSELDELAGICTRVLVMQEGRLVAEVAGEKTSELDLLRHAVTATGQADYRDEIAKEAQ